MSFKRVEGFFIYTYKILISDLRNNFLGGNQDVLYEMWDSVTG